MKIKKEQRLHSFYEGRRCFNLGVKTSASAGSDGVSSSYANSEVSLSSAAGPEGAASEVVREMTSDATEKLGKTTRREPEQKAINDRLMKELAELTQENGRLRNVQSEQNRKIAYLMRKDPDGMNKSIALAKKNKPESKGFFKNLFDSFSRGVDRVFLTSKEQKEMYVKYKNDDEVTKIINKYAHLEFDKTKGEFKPDLFGYDKEKIAEIDRANGLLSGVLRGFSNTEDRKMEAIEDAQYIRGSAVASKGPKRKVENNSRSRKKTAEKRSDTPPMPTGESRTEKPKTVAKKPIPKVKPVVNAGSAYDVAENKQDSLIGELKHLTEPSVAQNMFKDWKETPVPKKMSAFYKNPKCKNWRMMAGNGPDARFIGGEGETESTLDEISEQQISALKKYPNSKYEISHIQQKKTNAIVIQGEKNGINFYQMIAKGENNQVFISTFEGTKSSKDFHNFTKKMNTRISQFVIS